MKPRAALCTLATATLLAACSPIDDPLTSRGACITCHTEDRGRSTKMDHLFGGFPTQCELCHTEGAGWSAVHYDHGLQAACVTCHAKDRERPSQPDHLAKSFPETCEQCHGTDAWKPAKAPHDKFPLIGKHAALPCAACHTGQGSPPSICGECHADDRAGVSAPNHQKQIFADCAACHTPEGWRPALVEHNAFVLSGRHGFVACDGCHGQDPLPTTCSGCHDADRVRAKNPDHTAPNYPTDCGRCHSTDEWSRSALACNDCHGSATNDAPPVDVSKQSATTVRGVGAHLAHLEQSSWHAPVACAECHKVPAGIDDPGHNDTALPAEVIFTGMAVAGGAQPQWDGTSCSGSYCHGATLSGGKHTAPKWTQVDGTQVDCGSCHGLPPTANGHPTDPNCVGCHPKTVDANKKIIAPDLHINGIVEAEALDCYSCHGTAGTNSAPPKGTQGETATSARAVGAHQAHLVGGNWHVAVQCADCHLVPTNASEPGHQDTPLPAEVTFSAASKRGGAAPQWDGTSCSGSYCHGATLSGGKHTAPKWTQVDGSQSACDSCHGMPPQDKHSTGDTNCSACHTLTVDGQQQIIAPNLHINGKVEADVQCNSCHGGPTNDAPPQGTSGETATSARAVGAHQEHLKSSSWHAAVQCADCHVVPSTASAPGHNDTATPAEVTFSATAKRGGASPSWNGTSCAGTYCHGATLSAGKHTAPNWTLVDGSQSACDSCHGMPPTANGHSSSTACASCHPAVVDASQQIIAANLHINGQVEAVGAHPGGYGVGAIHAPDFYANVSTCTSCHGATLTGGTARSCAGSGCHTDNWKTDCTLCHGGTDNQTGAPPKATSGQTATSVAAVGRHTAHVTTTTTHGAYACAICHVNPSSVLSGGHVGPAPAELSFSGLAAGSAYDFASATCSNVYCHGNGRSTGTGSATWTGSISGGCAACHPNTGSGLAKGHTRSQHRSRACSECHACVVDSNGQIIDPAKHVNGTREVCGPKINSWNGSQCSTTCHGNESW